MADAQFGEQRQLDYDTGGGTDLIEVSGIVFPASGGGVAAGGVLETGVSAVGALAVGGATPHDSVDSGNPMKVGGKVTAVNPTGVSAGDRVDAHFDSKGRLGVFIASGYDGTGAATANTPTDAFTATAGLNTQSWSSVFNGTTWDRSRSITALDAAPNVDTGIPAAGIGPGWDRKTNPAGVAATNTANAVTVVTDGAASMIFHVTTIGTTPGSMIFEVTGDDTNWVTASGVIKMGLPPSFISGSFVPAVNDMYMVPCQGIRQVRYRVNAVYASGTATVKVSGSQAPWYVRAGVQGLADHDAVGTGSNPLLIGGYASAAAPSAVSADGDAVQSWYLRSGAQVGYEVGAGTNAASQVAISNTSTTVISARSQRKGVLITNKQTVGVALDISGGTAVYATHYVLDPGASIFLPVTNAITGITSAAYTATGDAKLHLLEIY